MIRAGGVSTHRVLGKLQIRAAASLNSAKVGTYNEGDTIEVLGADTADTGSGGWLRTPLGWITGEPGRVTALETAVASAPPLAQVQEAMAAPIGEAQQADFVVDSECVVCFDAPVNSCLRPCGHVAMCMMCASKIGANCPICRAGIEKVETYPSAIPTNSVVNPVTPSVESGGGSTLVPFIPSAKFDGVRDGFFYAHGDKGFGYYSKLASE
eukprot:COSAG02_NODE_190_length_30025_cov_22.989875_23_plen_211_part_00